MLLTVVRRRSVTDRSTGAHDDVPPVREMRLVVTADDHAEAVHFYRDVLGLPERASYSSPDGQVVILEAGRATLEIADRTQAEFIDRVEVGRRVAGHIRVAFEVSDSAATGRVLAEAGADVLAEATRTPWNTMNVRLNGPAGAAADALLGRTAGGLKPVAPPEPRRTRRAQPDAPGQFGAAACRQRGAWLT
jgi:lactoylglutathione lyase